MDNEYDDYGESADDMLESTRSNPLDAHVGNHPLPEDNDRPAAPADRHADTEGVEVDSPNTDTNVQQSELYENGAYGSSYASDQSVAHTKDDWVMINRWEDV